MKEREEGGKNENVIKKGKDDGEDREKVIIHINKLEGGKKVESEERKKRREESHTSRNIRFIAKIIDSDS